MVDFILKTIPKLFLSAPFKLLGEYLHKFCYRHSFLVWYEIINALKSWLLRRYFSKNIQKCFFFHISNGGWTLL